MRPVQPLVPLACHNIFFNDTYDHQVSYYGCSQARSVYSLVTAKSMTSGSSRADNCSMVTVAAGYLVHSKKREEVVAIFYVRIP